MSDQLLQDVQFQEGDDLPTLVRKLRILQEEVVSLRRALDDIPHVDSNDQAFIITGAALEDTASSGAYPVPGGAGGFIHIMVNGQPGRLAVYMP